MFESLNKTKKFPLLFVAFVILLCLFFYTKSQARYQMIIEDKVIYLFEPSTGKVYLRSWVSGSKWRNLGSPFDSNDND